MPILKLSLEDFDSIDYELIAIHSTLEDYRIAFFLNQALGIKFYKSNEEDIETNNLENSSYFSRYLFEDTYSDVFWNLISNKTYISKDNSDSISLFSDSNTSFLTPIYLLPELKNIDFILKIENSDYTFDINTIVDKIKSLNVITTAYLLDPNTIKSKDNLIF